MQTKEKPYEDREIEIDNRLTKLSHLTEEERSIYFAGVDVGEENGVSSVFLLLGLTAILTLIIWSLTESFK